MRENKALYRAGFVLLGLAALGWLGMIALSVFGIFSSSSNAAELLVSVGFLLPVCGGLGIVLILVQVIADRLSSKEDDYYSKNVER